MNATKPTLPMTLADFTAIVQATPEAVVLLEGRRSIPDHGAALATHTASMRVKHSPSPVQADGSLARKFIFKLTSSRTPR